jgi:putative AlgH/UPF0301 family transcriptional regulator
MTRFWGPVVLAAMGICGTAIASGPSTDVKDLGIGKLLVSSRGLADPNFVESVVLVIQYDQQGTVGLTINRRTRAPISRVFQDLNTAKDRSDPIYIGGPVEMTAVFGLFRSRKKPDGSASVLSEVYLLSSKAALEKALATSSGPGDFRLYLGYCGWAAGQLENELRRGGWWIVDGKAGLVFDPDPGSVWSRLIAQTEQQIAETELVGGRSP